jgi:hypothetical protein
VELSDEGHWLSSSFSADLLRSGSDDEPAALVRVQLLSGLSQDQRNQSSKTTDIFLDRWIAKRSAAFLESPWLGSP